MLINTQSYDPTTFWNAQAKKNIKDMTKAVCYSNPLRNICIDAVQRVLIRGGMQTIQRRSSLYGKKVLDYGCGIGRWVEFFQRAGCIYSGLDIAKEMIKIAKKRYPKVDFQTLDNDRIPYPSKSYDIVCSIAVIHHNHYPHQEEILDEIVRVLRPGGFLLLFEGIGPSDPSTTFMFVRTRNEWITLLTRRGLECLWTRGGRYFLVESIIETLIRKSRQNKTSNSVRIPRSILKIDTVLSPFLGSFLPERYQNRAAMVFKLPEV